jgi:hypothetical protein
VACRHENAAERVWAAQEEKLVSAAPLGLKCGTHVYSLASWY